jgi:hypothetical protein
LDKRIRYRHPLNAGGICKPNRFKDALRREGGSHFMHNGS